MNKSPPVKSRLAAAARTGLGPSSIPGRPKTTPPRKMQITDTRRRLLARP